MSCERSNRLVSICIPTCNRPDFLRQAIESCAAQSYKPIEILVGDDSDISSLDPGAYRSFEPGIDLRYFQNRPRLGQARNINRLFDEAAGDRIVLLHDDDLLLPNAIEDLDRCWSGTAGISAAFGKQMLMDDDGNELSDEELNSLFYRTPNLEGAVLTAKESALVRQFPNDGYLVSSQLAKAIKFSDASGEWCDFDFGLRLAQRSDKFLFLNTYTAKYRLSKDAISRRPPARSTCEYAYDQVLACALPATSEWARTKAIRGILPHLLAALLKESRRDRIAEIVLSRSYPWRDRLTPRGLYHLLMCAFPSLIASIRYS